MMNSLNFCQSERILTLLCFLKQIFAVYRCQYFTVLFFFFRIRCLLARRISDENLLSFFIVLHLSFSPLVLLRFLSSLGFENLGIMCLGVFFFTFLLLKYMRISWICEFIIFIKFDKTLATISVNIFLFLPFLFFRFQLHINCTT